MKIVRNLVITGHRPPRLGGYRSNIYATRTRDYMRGFFERLQQRHDFTLHLGMAQGVDMMAAKLAIELEIPFIAYIPGPDHGSRWPDWVFDAYSEVVSHAAARCHVSPYIIEYSIDDPNVEWEECPTTGGRRTVHPRSYGDMMNRRNMAMALEADCCLAIWDEKSQGGTYNMITHVKKHYDYPLAFMNPFKPNQKPQQIKRQRR